MNLPRGPENLCFDKDEFMKVGSLSLHKRRVSLGGDPGEGMDVVCVCAWLVCTSSIVLLFLVHFQPDFDVDHFVSECRKRVQLEELREDLELYYKLLKTAMVELINKDYADFVNLSTNLVSATVMSMLYSL